MSRSKVIQTGKNAIVEYLDSKKNAIVEYLDYQIPVRQLMGPKGIGDMQAAKRDKMRHLRRYTHLSVMGVRVGVQIYFWISR